MVGTDDVRFGKHSEIRFLPKEIANFLHEFHAYDFPILPSLPSDRSRVDVHATLAPIDIGRLLRRLQVKLMCINM